MACRAATRARHQAIDMNQDNVLAETLKCRNLVTELLPSTKGTFRLFADDDDEVQITRKTIASELLYVMRMRQVGTAAPGSCRRRLRCPTDASYCGSAW